MYTRPDFARRRTSVPENYGGTVFSEGKDGEAFVPPPTEAGDSSFEVSYREKEQNLPIRSSLFGLNAEDLLLLGVIFLLSQSDAANDIIPLLLILLLC